MDRGLLLALIVPSHPAGPWASDDTRVRVQRPTDNGTRGDADMNGGGDEVGARCG
jgi:hypothetical protein